MLFLGINGIALQLLTAIAGACSKGLMWRGLGSFGVDSSGKKDGNLWWCILIFGCCILVVHIGGAYWWRILVVHIGSVKGLLTG